MDPTVRTTLDLVRRAKNPNELDTAFQHLLKCVSMLSSASKTVGSRGILNTEERDRLLPLSVLIGAFCRRVEYLCHAQTVNTAYEAEPNEEAALRFRQYVETVMETLWNALDPLRKRVRACASTLAELSASSAATRPASAPSPSRSGGLLSAPVPHSAERTVLDIMVYGFGALCDYYSRRRSEVHQALVTLLRHPRWEPQTVVERLVAMQRLKAHASVGDHSPASGASLHVAKPQGGVTAVHMTSPLRDPLSRLPLQLPARGPQCAHLDVFDLTSLVRAAQQQQHQHRASGQRGKASPCGLEVSCPVCLASFDLCDVCIDVEARAALQVFYTEQPMDTIDADRFCFEWHDLGGTHTVKIAARPQRGEKRPIAAVDTEADEGTGEDNTTRKIPRTE